MAEPTGNPSEVQQFYIHAGLPKTGTSYLQSLFFGSRAELRDQGLRLIPRARADHLNVTLAARGMAQSFDAEVVDGALDRFGRQADRNSSPKALLTQEALAPMRPDYAHRLLDRISRYEVHLVVTARDLGRQLPSAWQQRMQGRRTFGYAEFLDAAVNRTELAADFWWNQDLPDVLARWSQVIPKERIHLVTCPRPGAPKTLLLERFCSVLGIDHTRLDLETAHTVNRALGLPQAELLRRVNIALGDRFPHSRAGYRRLGQAYLAGQVLQRQNGAPARLPSSLRPWVDEVTEGWLSELRDVGYEVVGDLEDLRTSASAFVDEPADFSDARVLDTAAVAIADILEIRNEELKAWEADRARLKELEERVRMLEPGNRWRPQRVAAAVRRRVRATRPTRLSGPADSAGEVRED